MHTTTLPTPSPTSTDVSALHSLLLAHGPDSVQIVDVRSPAEHAEIHIAGSRLVPLESVSRDSLQPLCNTNEPLYLLCRSGNRAAHAIKKLQADGLNNVVLVEGGIVAWEEAGLPVTRGERKVIPLERQVRIAAGILVVTGVVLGAFLHPAFLLLAGFVGAGLVFAGITDSCGMALVLARMPWNQHKPTCSPDVPAN